MILHTRADAVIVQSDEQGFELFIETEDGDAITVNIQSCVFDFHKEFMREIHSYILEAEHARATYVPPVDEDAYDRENPKSPGYYERMVGDA